MVNELQASKIHKPLRVSSNIFKLLGLVLLMGLATSCNSIIDESIRGCEEGIESACRNISANEWAKKQVVTSKGKEALALALNKVKYS